MKTIASVSKLILVAFFLLSVMGGTAQTKDSTTLVVKKTKDFIINGNGNAVEWSKAEYLELPKRKSGSMNYQTKMKILYSETGIYCLYECEDKMKIT